MAGNSNVGLQKFSLRELHPDIYNALIVGIIIGKQRPRIFTNLKRENNTDRAVWNFTLRDSIQDYINVTCWSNEQEITYLNDSFHIGDVGNLFFINKIFYLRRTLIGIKSDSPLFF